MKFFKELVIFGIILAILLIAGCMNSPKDNQTAPSEAQNKVRYVEINLLDGTKIGGKYLSETAAFTNIIPLYVIDHNGIMTHGNGVESGVATNLISLMVTIDDPSAYINTTLSQQEIAKKERERELAEMDAEQARRNAEILNKR